MADLKTLGPHIRKAIALNVILVTYFLSPSFLSFVAVAVVLGALVFSDPVQSIKSLVNWTDECSISGCFNETFQKFKKLSIPEQILLVVLLKLTIDFTWLLPTWLVVLLAVETWAAWGILEQLGLVELGQKYLKLVTATIQKVDSLIPRYQSK